MIKFIIIIIMNQITSLPAEHILQDEKRVPLCSRVARKNLGILLGFWLEQLNTPEVYLGLNFAPIWSAVKVHHEYKSGWKSPDMVWEYCHMREYGEDIWQPTQDAVYADLFFWTTAGHRCIAFRKQNEWYVLDPYFHSKDVTPLNMPVPLKTYCSFVYYIRWAVLEWVAFYRGTKE